MAETKKVVAKATDENGEIKTKQVEIIKFHPLVAHDVGDTPIMEEAFADELIEKKFAKAVK